MKNQIALISLAVMLALSMGLIGCGGGGTPETIEYTLTVSSTEGGSVTSPGEGDFAYDEGTDVDLVAEADEGYQFVDWTGDVETIADVSAASTTTTMNGNYTITANFAVIPLTHYDLTLSSTAGGSVTAPGGGTFTYDAGIVVNLVATTEEGYRFVNWTGDVSTVANLNTATTTVTMNGNYYIMASFEEIQQYGLTISSTAGGSVTTPAEGTSTYDEGTVVNLVATPASGYRFVNWTGNVGTVANVNSASTTITMHGYYSVTANFARQYNLTISSTDGGSVTAPGEGTFTYIAGTVVNLVAAPANCYDFSYWIGDVGTVGNVSAASTTITMNDNYSITAYISPPGVLQSANTEFHQAQTAIVATLADGETNQLTAPSADSTASWSGEQGTVYVVTGNVTYDAADHIYGTFGATYTVQHDGSITNGYCDYSGGWGDCIIWDPIFNGWIVTP
jgi:uncharacterized repeat protein (TIGR02543 family)